MTFSGKDSDQESFREKAVSVQTAAIVVTYNSADDLPVCLTSLALAGLDEVVVVDNASVDDSACVAAEYGANVVCSPQNRGYASAVNRGAAAVRADTYLVLNPDTEVSAHLLPVLRERLRQEADVAVVGPLVRNPDQTVQLSCRRFPSVTAGVLHGFLGLVWENNPFSRWYLMADWDHASPSDVDWVSGAAMLIRREAFEEVGGFDEGYFMYVEDVDFCWRLRQAGWRVAYEPRACVSHVGGTSSTKAPYRLLIAHHRSMLRFEKRRRSARHLTKSARFFSLCTWPFLVGGVAGRAGILLALRWGQRRVREKRRSAQYVEPGVLGTGFSDRAPVTSRGEEVI